MILLEDEEVNLESTQNMDLVDDSSRTGQDGQSKYQSIVDTSNSIATGYQKIVLMRLLAHYRIIQKHKAK